MAQVCIRYRCFVATACVTILISIRYTCTAFKVVEQPETPETVVSSTHFTPCFCSAVHSTCCVGLDLQAGMPSGSPMSPFLHCMDQLDMDTLAQVLLPKLMQQGSAHSVALTCSRLRDLC
jgi:hypothetical protein